MVAARMRYEEGSYEGEVNEAKNPEGQGTFEYRGDDEAARLMYDGGWKDKAAEGYGVMKWQNGDRYEGDWVEGLREGKGKYLSKATGENAPPASDDQNDGGSQGANTRGSMQPT